MRLTDPLLDRLFGHPSGVLGRIGGRLMTTPGKRELAAIALAEVDPGVADRVLEVGFGPGIGIECAAASVPDGFVAGVDSSMAMVGLAHDRNAAAIEVGRVAVSRGTVCDLPYADETFDAVFSLNSMQVWPDSLVGLQEIRRVLIPGGRVALGFTPIAGQPRDAVVSILARAGFVDIAVRDADAGFCATGEA